MTDIEAVVAIVFLIAFLFGITFGVVLIVSWASNREDRRHSLRGKAPGAIAAGARKLVGAGSWRDGRQAGAPGGLPGDWLPGDGPGDGPDPGRGQIR